MQMIPFFHLRWLWWLGFFNACLLTCLGMLYLRVSPPGNWQEGLFSLAGLYSQFIAFAFILNIFLSILLLLSFKWKFSRHLFLVFAWLLYGVLVSIIFVDTQVFSMFRFHINGMVLGFFTHGVASHVFVFSTKMWTLAFFIFFGLFVLEGGMIFLTRHLLKKYKKLYGFWLAFASFIVLLSFHLVHAIAFEKENSSLVYQARIIPWGQPLDISELLDDLGIVDKSKKRAPLIKRANKKNKLRYPLSPLECRPEETPNIVFLLVETFRFDMLTEDIMPNAYAFSKKSMVFHNHFSTGSATRFGVFGLFYGLYGYYWDQMLYNSIGPVFIKELAKNNYDFQIYGSAPLIFPEFDRTVFADIRDKVDFKVFKGTPPQRDRYINGKALSYLDKGTKEPFFMFLFYDSPHNSHYPKDFKPPFLPARNNLIGLTNETDRTPFFNQYKNSIHFVDQEIGKVLSKLKKKNLMDKTMIIITGDHGVEFNDNKLNYWGSNSNYTRYQTQVPLVIYWPKKEKKDYFHVTSHVDLTPTLMKDILGCKNPFSEYANGRNLKDASPRKYILMSGWEQYAIVEKDQIIVSHDIGGLFFYDLNYRRLEKGIMSPDVSLSVVKELSRFR